MYGRQEITFLCARSLLSWFAIPGFTSSSTNDTSAGNGLSLDHFIAYLIYRTKTPDVIVIGAMYLLDRLRLRVGRARGSTGYHLFTTALVLAWKIISDDVYSTKSWAQVTRGMFTVHNINRMEREMCLFLGWGLHIDSDAFNSFEASFRTGILPLVPAITPEAASSAHHAEHLMDAHLPPPPGIHRISSSCRPGVAVGADSAFPAVEIPVNPSLPGAVAPGAQSPSSLSPCRSVYSNGRPPLLSSTSSAPSTKPSSTTFSDTDTDTTCSASSTSFAYFTSSSSSASSHLSEPVLSGSGDGKQKQVVSLSAVTSGVCTGLVTNSSDCVSTRKVAMEVPYVRAWVPKGAVCGGVVALLKPAIW